MPSCCGLGHFHAIYPRMFDLKSQVLSIGAGLQESTSSQVSFPQFRSRLFQVDLSSAVPGDQRPVYVLPQGDGTVAVGGCCLPEPRSPDASASRRVPGREGGWQCPELDQQLAEDVGELGGSGSSTRYSRRESMQFHKLRMRFGNWKPSCLKEEHACVSRLCPEHS